MIKCGPADDPGHFSTTQWSVVLEAAQTDSERSRAALQKLCSRYWRPVYAYALRKGRTEHEAEDVTQGFFQFLLSEQVIGKADRTKGRFRTFLLGALTNYLHNEHDRQQTLKRGRGIQFIPSHELAPEGTYLSEGQSAFPEQQFDHSWAATLIERVLAELRREYEQRGKGALFAGLRSCLTGEPVAADYERIGQQFGMEPGAVKVALHRARRRFGELLRHEVAHTVQKPEDVEDEIRHLLRAIST